MKILTTAIVLGLALTAGSFSLAQDVEKDAKKDAPEKKEEPAKPEFKERKALLAHFQAKRELLQTKIEVEQRKTKPNPKTLEELHKGFREIDANQLRALVAYVKANPKADDIAAARYDLVDMNYRLGNWQASADAATSFLALHGEDNKGLKRQASYYRGAAMLNIEGKEAEAVKALEGVANAFQGHLEGDLARRDLLRAYLLADKPESATKLINDILKIKAVQDDDDAYRWAKEQRHMIVSIGKKVPAANFTTLDEKTTSVDTLVKKGKPLILWYWDSRDGLSLRMKKDMEALAKKYAGKVEVCAISVNKSSSVWRQAAKADNKSSLTHLFEGRVDSDELSSRKLGVERFPLALLVGKDRKIHRFDTPTRDLSRVVKAWLAAKGK